MYKKIVISLVIMLNAIFSSIVFADVPIATDSRIKTYVYNENDVYLLLISTGFQSSIEFEKGEKVKTISLGDSYSWSLTPIDSRLIIKPLENNVRTNMMIITNMRNYHFDIVSKAEDFKAQDISYVVRFHYPKMRGR